MNVSLTRRFFQVEAGSDGKLGDGFEEAFTSACEAALKGVLGASGLASTVYYLGRQVVVLVDCARRGNLRRFQRG